MDLDPTLPDLRGGGPALALDANSYVESQALAGALPAAGSDALVYPSRRPGGRAAGFSIPTSPATWSSGRHLDHRWDGTRVDLAETRAARCSGSGRSKAWQLSCFCR
jgi:hypothetical protein